MMKFSRCEKLRKNSPLDSLKGIIVVKSLVVLTSFTYSECSSILVVWQMVRDSIRVVFKTIENKKENFPFCSSLSVKSARWKERKKTAQNVVVVVVVV